MCSTAASPLWLGPSPWSFLPFCSAGTGAIPLLSAPPNRFPRQIDGLAWHAQPMQALGPKPQALLAVCCVTNAVNPAWWR